MSAPPPSRSRHSNSRPRKYRLGSIQGTFAPTLAHPTPERLSGPVTEHTTSTDGPTKGSGGLRYLPFPLHTKRSWRSNAAIPPQLVETTGTALMVLIGGELSATVVGYETAQIGAYIGISTALLLTTFIYATAPASGGHLNPLVSLATMCTGLCPVPRGEFYRQVCLGVRAMGVEAVLYMCGQTAGAALAAGGLTAVCGRERSILYVLDLPSGTPPPPGGH